jgi:hypothetical protein
MLDMSEDVRRDKVPENQRYSYKLIYYCNHARTFKEQTVCSMLGRYSRSPQYTTMSVEDSNGVTENVTLRRARRAVRVFQLGVFKENSISIDKLDDVTMHKIAFSASYEAISSGRKTGGADGIRPTWFREDKTRLSDLGREVLLYFAGRVKHHFAKCRMCPIPKKDGTVRMLSVPNIADNARINCLVALVTPLAERLFQEVWEESDRRFLVSGSRIKHGVGTAISCLKQLHKRIGRAYKAHIIFCDIASCFPSIPYKLVEYVLTEINVPVWVRSEILKASKVFMIGNPQRTSNKKGLPQGNPISPLICNIVVTFLLRKYIVHSKLGAISYLDDLVVVCPEGVNPQHVLADLSRCLDRFGSMKVGMTLKDAKTEIISGQRRSNARWLGVDVWLRPSTKWRTKATSIKFSLPSNYIADLVSKCSQVIRTHKRKHRKRLWRMEPEKLVRKWQPIILGSVNYFGLFMNMYHVKGVLFKRLVWRLNVYYLGDKYNSRAFHDLLLLLIFEKLAYIKKTDAFDSTFGTLNQ